MMNGAWLSLVERLVWDQEVAGSNPAAPILSLDGKDGSPEADKSSRPVCLG